MATTFRISKIKDELALATIQRDHLRKFDLLGAYYLELMSILNEPEITECDALYIEVKSNYWEYKSAIATGKKTINKSIIDNIFNFEKKLRMLEQKHDLNLPKKGDPRFAGGHSRN